MTDKGRVLPFVPLTSREPETPAPDHPITKRRSGGGLSFTLSIDTDAIVRELMKQLEARNKPDGPKE